QCGRKRSCVAWSALAKLQEGPITSDAHANRLARFGVHAEVDERVVRAFLGLFHGVFEAPVMLITAIELPNEIEPLPFASRNLIKILFHFCGELDVDQIAEMLTEKTRHGERGKTRHERLALPEDIAAALDRADCRCVC